MQKEVEYHDQGMGVLPSHLVIAEEYLRQNKKPKNFENMKKAVIKLAAEKKESYTPSDDMGKNPSPRISAKVKNDMAPWLYSSKFQYNVINPLGLSESDRRALMIELNGAINHLTQIILKRVYGFKTTRAPKVDLADPKQLTDFEYVASGPDGLSKQDRDKINTQVDVNRQIRGMVQAYISAAILPLLNDNKNNIYKVFLKIYKDANPKIIRGNNAYKNIMKHMAKNLWIQFKGTRISDYVKHLRVTPKGAFLEDKSSKK